MHATELVRERERYIYIYTERKIEIQRQRQIERQTHKQTRKEWPPINVLNFCAATYPLRLLIFAKSGGLQRVPRPSIPNCCPTFPVVPTSRPLSSADFLLPFPHLPSLLKHPASVSVSLR